MIKVGVIGYGYWGPNLVRNFNAADTSEVKYVCDLDSKRLNTVKKLYPKTELTSDLDQVLKDPEVDAVAIATPVSTHFDLALQSLKAGKCVVVEKPLSDSSDKCQQLLDEADKQNLTLMVDHTFPYTGAVRKIKELVETGQLGDIYYYDSVRVNLGLFQHDVNVIWDLAVHDLSIIEFCLAEKPVSVSCVGINHLQNQPEDVAFLTLFFQNNLIAHVNVNWLAPVKVRHTLVGGTQKMVVYNDLEPAEKIKIYDKGISLETDRESIHAMRVGYRSGDMIAPKLDGAEALKLMVTHFAHCIETGEKPMTNAESGARIVRIMEAATESMKNHGKPVEL